MLTHNYLLPHYISYLQLFTLTLNYIFSLNIVEAIDYDSAFTTQLPAKLAEYSKFRSTFVLRIESRLTHESRSPFCAIHGASRVSFGLNQVTRINPLPSSLTRCQRPSKLFTMNK